MNTSVEHTEKSRNQANQLATPCAVTVVIVTYNSAATIAMCLDSIPSDAEVVVVDQVSADHTVECALLSRPDARVIRAGSNRGFGAGCNLGAANANGEVLVFLNPDACFHDGTLARIVAKTTQLNTLVGPRIVGATGEDETRARQWSTFHTDVLEIISPPRLVPRRYKRDIDASDRVYRCGGYVPYVQGSCMSIPAALFAEVGGFDEAYFLYHEEEKLAAAAAGLGHRTWLDIGSVITHLGGHSTAQVSLFAARQYYRSRTLAYRQLNGTVTTIAMGTAIVLSLAMMALLTPIRRLVGFQSHRRADWYLAGTWGAISGIMLKIEQPPRNIR